MNPLIQIPEDFSALSEDELRSFIADAKETVEQVAANPSEFLTEGRSAAGLMDEVAEGVAALEAARAELASREPETDEIDAEALAALAARASEVEVPEALSTEDTPTDDDPEHDPDDDPEPDDTATAAEAEPAATEPETATADADTPAEPVTASAPKRRPKPARSTRSEPKPAPQVPVVSMTAAAENLGPSLGQEIGGDDIARMMVMRRRQIGDVPEGTHGDQVPIAKADWRDLYPEELHLGTNEVLNMERIEAVTASARIRAAFDERRAKDPGSLTASGGLCAPVTPYYSLQMLSVADRPVRNALPSFNADRGGIRAAAPAKLTAITDAVGIITEAEDSAGGSPGTKTCQVIDCPPFSEVDVSSIFHCIQFGNLGARTFPELVAQWNQLVLAAHARTAETALLDGIATHSTAVTAGALGLGASATLPSQILTAADGMRSRHRMDPNAVLRVLLPFWVLDLLVSDMYRSQFDRFDMSKEQFVALLRRGNVEPSFYLDGPTGGAQVFGVQAAAGLLNFPDTVRWYIYPEGSFLYLDGGTLELGLVRDSVLNATNDFQIFGETWENVAFVGVESLQVTTTVCDSGRVTLPVAVTCPIDY